MPFKSEAQRRYLWATNPTVAREMAHKTPKGTKLPYHVSPRMAALDKVAKRVSTKGSPPWERPSPAKKSKKLTPAQRARAKAAARRSGRPYPNLVDNMRAARGKR